MNRLRKPNVATTERLARAFSAELLKDIGRVGVAKVVAENAAEKDPHICHSHDYCDANMTMHNAGVALGLDLDWGKLEDSDLVDAAWKLATAKGFYLR